MRNGRLGAVAVVALALAGSASSEAAQCGSALLLEVSAPAVFDGFTPSAPMTTRFWEAGAGGSDRSDLGCLAGCTNASGPLCVGGGDCLALTGVNWLNAACAVPGHLPARTVLVVEQATADSGGRWAAINLDRNASDANTDLDAKAAVVCGGCASIASPYLGGIGYPEVPDSQASSGMLAATLTWSGPPAAAQALSNGSNLVTSYAVFYRGHSGPPPPATGDPTVWSLVPDLQADGAANGGFSTDTTAVVDLPVPIGIETVTFAIRLNFDGSGNPTSDPNTLAASLLSDQSDPVPAVSLIFADGFETGDLSAWSGAFP